MPIVVTQVPPALNSLGDDIIYRAGFSADGSYTVPGSDPITGLTIIETTTATSFSTGQDILILGGSYEGITTIVGTASANQYIINIPYIDSSGGNYVEPFGTFGYMSRLFLFGDNVLSTPPSLPTATVAIIKWEVSPRVPVLEINVSEYLRSVFPIGTPDTDDSVNQTVYFGLDFFDGFYLEGFTGDYTKHALINSSITTAELQAIYDTTNARLVNEKPAIFFPDQSEFYSYFVKDGTYQSFTAILNVPKTYAPLATGFPEFEVYNMCYQDAINIVYLNPCGGYRNYVLSNEYRNEQTFSSVGMYKTANKSDRFSLIESNQQYTYTLKSVRCTHADNIAQMIASVQAWIVTSVIVEGAAVYTFTPIMIDKKSFVTEETFRPYIDAVITFTTADITLSQLN